MQIGPRTRDITFSRIDTPLEGFVTPPNDPLAGLLMGLLPRESVEIRGAVGGREFAYTYSTRGGEITMEGAFDRLPFAARGTFDAARVTLGGAIGGNELSSELLADTQGPRLTSRSGDVAVDEKIDFVPSTGEFRIRGRVGGDELDETIVGDPAANRVRDTGTLGGAPIEREARPCEGGFHVTGTIGGVRFEEFIIAKPPAR